MDVMERVRQRNAEQGRLNRLRGLNFEFRVLRKLKKECEWAVRPEGSHGPFDVIGRNRRGQLVLVVVKINGYINPQERKAIERYRERKMIWEVLKLAYYVSPKKFIMEDL